MVRAPDLSRYSLVSSVVLTVVVPLVAMMLVADVVVEASRPVWSMPPFSLKKSFVAPFMFYN